MHPHLHAGFVAEQDSAFLSFTRDTCGSIQHHLKTHREKSLTLTCTFLPYIHPWSTQLLGFSGNGEGLEKAANITAWQVAQLQLGACCSTQGTDVG